MKWNDEYYDSLKRSEANPQKKITLAATPEQRSKKKQKRPKKGQGGFTVHHSRSFRREDRNALYLFQETAQKFLSVKISNLALSSNITMAEAVLEFADKKTY
jgi:hypothetical protein